MRVVINFMFVLTLLACKSSDLSTSMSKNTQLTYLALGDSYTIGEGVPENDRYSVQLVDALNHSGKMSFSAPQIIAKTGWTVDELDAGINSANTKSEGYDLVTLLIGVNNQYRGRPVEDFEKEFELILNRAIIFARGETDHVVVLSVPDWGVTPFAVNRKSDQAKVAKEIDAYNSAQKAICRMYGITFIDITKDYRAIGARPEMVVEDQLHPSGLVYQRWMEKLLSEVKKIKF
ncbi:SGNH/GDSL hydrolase family protein [Algoriphagus boritolerans]|uniref:Lysophospholipase L1 n=1 Tax=Algoriphagus boritolerans DSM 17298 = JCM 18970 TaxID=1120964 RepID=A0A1H5XZA9_9BACT|nr:SGNH/GDSL hydrolase family protein [Algoriphagus boritolerans]SEG17104.1 Lysophospholipase L1 [Algoriphagus boritolerans DSM 17298 = JCM 18970]